MTILERLRLGRILYASAPSHAPFKTSVADDTYCAVTALGAMRDERDSAEALLASAAGLKRLPLDSEPVIVWNAESTTAEVLAAFDRAIAWEEAKQQEHADPTLVDMPADELVTA